MKVNVFGTNILTLAAVVAVYAGHSNNYCDLTLCPKGGPHIACHGLMAPSDTCGAGSFEVLLNSAKRNLIVDLHNRFRNKVALGKLANGVGQNFSQAAKMATMQWDNELANIAAANARRCTYGHDKCRNTATMKAVGQNLAYIKYYGKKITDKQIITDFLYDWFSEYKDTNPMQIASYPKHYNGPQIGHFTQMVADRVSKIGCSMISYKENKYTKKELVCNYGLTNIVKQPIYVVGTACSGCTTGCNSVYPGLCSAAEVIRNNP